MCNMIIIIHSFAFERCLRLDNKDKDESKVTAVPTVDTSINDNKLIKIIIPQYCSIVCCVLCMVFCICGGDKRFHYY